MALHKQEILKMQIKRTEKQLRDLPHHKGTDHFIGRLRARLAKLNESLNEPSKKSSGGGGGYAVKKQGDATIVLVGPPSSGKSTLINKLTNAQSKVAPYAFTTISVIPGMMKYRNSYIQILDVPGLIEGAQKGKGRGREVISVARGANLIIFITDPQRIKFFEKLTQELENAGLRINQEPPNVRVEKKVTGGLLINSNIKQDIDKETVKEVAEEFGIKNAQITINEKLTLSKLIDSFAKNRVYLPAIYVVNKADTLKTKPINKEFVFISAEKETGLENLKELIWEKLGFVTVYLIKPDEEPNFKNPMVVKRNLTLQKLIEKIGTDFAKNKTKAKIWGRGAKFEGQEVSLNTKVEDEMQIRFI